VYLNRRNDLLIIPRGYSIPSEMADSWRKKKRAVRSVSETIRQDLQRRSYHRRRLIESRLETVVEGTN
jgi:hypothetical protein